MNSDEKVANEIVNRNRHSRFANKRNEMKLRIKIGATVVLLAIISSVGFTTSTASATQYSPTGKPALTFCFADQNPDYAQLYAIIEQDFPGQYVSVNFVYQQSDGTFSQWSPWTPPTNLAYYGRTVIVPIRPYLDYTKTGTQVKMWVTYAWFTNGVWKTSAVDRVLFSGGGAECPVFHWTPVGGSNPVYPDSVA